MFEGSYHTPCAKISMGSSVGWGGGTSLHTTCLTHTYLDALGPQAIHTSGGLGVDVHCWPCRVMPGGGACTVVMVALTVLATELGVGAMCMASISGGKTAWMRDTNEGKGRSSWITGKKRGGRCPIGVPNIAHFKIFI